MARQATGFGWTHALALLALAAFLWIGWRDFDPYLSQAVVQAGVRDAIRGAVQLLVQFVAPAILVAYLVHAAIDRRRSSPVE